MSDVEALYRAVEENPKDFLRKLVLADALEEVGDPKAAGYRAMGKCRLMPWVNLMGVRWSWWYNLRRFHRESRIRIEYPVDNSHSSNVGELHRRWFVAVKRLSTMYVVSQRYQVVFDSFRQAEDAAAVAFDTLHKRLQDMYLAVDVNPIPSKTYVYPS